MPYIFSFGGSFLLMVFLNFFLSDNESQHWLPLLENNCLVRKIRQYNGGYILLAVLIGLIIICNINNEMQGKLAISYLLGIIIHESIGQHV